MKRREFNERMEKIKVGDWVMLNLRGNYGQYRAQGRFRKVENGRVYLDKGLAHSYRRILSIDDFSD